MLSSNQVLKFLTFILLLVFVGCTNATPHRSWPKPVSASTLNQFAGVYKNKSSDNKTGKAKNIGSGFYYFLTSESDYDARYDGDRLSIQFSPDCRLMMLRLYDAHGKVIKSADLKRGVQFDFNRGMIVRKVGSQGFSGGIESPYAGINHNSYELHMTATGGILGHESSSGGVLVAYIVPIVGGENLWSYWPRF